MTHWIFPFALGVFGGAALIGPLAYLTGKARAFSQMTDENRDRREKSDRKFVRGTAGA